MFVTGMLDLQYCFGKAYFCNDIFTEIYNIK